MTVDPKKQFGERIRRARRDADLKQNELADLLGISQAVVSNVDNVITTIDVPDLPRWAEVLNKPIMYFFEDESQDWQQRALDILRMFSKERLSFVLHMLKNMALTIHEADISE